MFATTIVNENDQKMYFVTPLGLSVMGKTKIYETYQKMISDPNPPSFAWCLDATGDKTVDEGAAFYVYRNNHYQKLYESEAMDNENFGKPEGYDELVITVNSLEELAATLAKQDDLVNHTNNINIHVSKEDKMMWDNKVDKIPGKGLTSNDYTTEEKEKLSSLKNYDDTAIKQSIRDLDTKKFDKQDALELQNRVGIMEQSISVLENTVATQGVVLNVVQDEVLGSRNLLDEIDGMIGHEVD